MCNESGLGAPRDFCNRQNRPRPILAILTHPVPTAASIFVTMTSERKGPVSWRKGWTITAVFATAYCATLLTAAFFASGVKQVGIECNPGRAYGAERARTTLKPAAVSRVQVDSSAETASLPLLRQSIRWVGAALAPQSRRAARQLGLYVQRGPQGSSPSSETSLFKPDWSSLPPHC